MKIKKKKKKKNQKEKGKKGETFHHRSIIAISAIIRKNKQQTRAKPRTHHIH
jgi:hypothetical protein